MGKNIIIFRLSSMGDVILSMSVLNSKVLSQSQVTWVVAQEFAALFENDPRVKRVISIPRKETSSFRWIQLCWQLSKTRPDEVWDLHGSLRTRIAQVVFFLGSPEVLWSSISKERLRRVLFFVLKEFLPNHFRPTSWLRRYQAFMNDGGIRPDLRHLLSRSEKNHESMSHSFVGLMASSQWPGKQWPTDRFESFALKLASQSPETRFMVFGAKSDTTADSLFEKLKRGHLSAERVVGTLAEIAQPMSRCRWILTNDTGLGHFAEALGIPAKVLFGPTHPDLGFEPFLEESLSLGRSDLMCRPCNKDGSFCYRFWEPYACLKGYSVDLAFSQSSRLSSRARQVTRPTLRASISRTLSKLISQMMGSGPVALSVRVHSPIRIWVHAASVGELEMVWPVAIELAARWSDQAEWVVTSFSQSAESSVARLAAEIREKGGSIRYFGLSPREGFWREALEVFEPQFFLTAKYEAWPELWCSLSELQIQLVVIEAMNRPSMRLAKKILGLLGTPLPGMNVTVPSLSERAQFQKLMPHAHVSIEKNPRWDRVFDRQSREQSKTAKWKARGLNSPRPWLVLASVYAEDFSHFATAWESFSGTIWVFPHHLKGPKFDQLIELPEFKKFMVKPNTILVDEMGVLTPFLVQADRAYVGGGWNRSIHSTLEPAAARIPVACGPRGVAKFPEAVELQQLGILTVVQNHEEMQDWFRQGIPEGTSTEPFQGVSQRVVRWVLDSKIGMVETKLCKKQ